MLKCLVKYFKLVFRDFQRSPLICFLLIWNLTKFVLFKNHQNKEKPSEESDKVDSPEEKKGLKLYCKDILKAFFHVCKSFQICIKHQLRELIPRLRTESVCHRKYWEYNTAWEMAYVLQNTASPELPFSLEMLLQTENVSIHLGRISLMKSQWVGECDVGLISINQNKIFLRGY